MELTYTKQGDFLIPDLKLPQNPNLGKYAMMRRSFLKENKLGLYTGMMLSGRLNIHLTEVEKLKATDQMAWVRQMNSIRTRAEESVRSQLICS